jgi:hypothetical protein
VPFIESPAEFTERHGRCVPLDNGYWLFHDGALISDDGVDRHEPPDDPYQLALLIEEYHEELYNRAADEFDDLRDRLKRAGEAAVAGNGSPPPTRELERLKALRKKVLKRLERLDKARKKVDRLKPEKLRRRDRLQAELRAEGEEFLGRLRDIKL